MSVRCTLHIPIQSWSAYIYIYLYIYIYIKAYGGCLVLWAKGNRRNYAVPRARRTTEHPSEGVEGVCGRGSNPPQVGVASHGSGSTIQRTAASLVMCGKGWVAQIQQQTSEYTNNINNCNSYCNRANKKINI